MATPDDFLDEAAVRGLLSSVFDVCVDCRRCIDRCGSFPTLFDLVDRRAEVSGVVDAGMMTPSEQDQVVAGCHGCGMCAIGCPADPPIDVPAAMRRARAMQHANGLLPIRDTVSDRLIALRPGSSAGPLASRLADVVGMPSPSRRQRFSRWFAGRPGRSQRRAEATATLLPTCLVEYQAPEIGRALVGVYEHHGIDVDVVDAGCCGAPWLASGNDREFRSAATRLIGTLASIVESGRDVVVAQPTCGYTIRSVYPDAIGRDDADLVAAHVHDAATYLVEHIDRSRSPVTPSETAVVPETITLHVACHSRAVDPGHADDGDGSRALLALTGATVRVIDGCAGVGFGRPPAGDPDVALGADPGVIVGTCRLANEVLGRSAGATVLDPFQVLAELYGLDR